MKALEERMLEIVLWNSSLTTKVVELVSSQIEFGIKFNFLTDVVKKEITTIEGWETLAVEYRFNYGQDSFWL
jgi:hypothetical protein